VVRTEWVLPHVPEALSPLLSGAQSGATKRAARITDGVFFGWWPGRTLQSLLLSDSNPKPQFRCRDEQGHARGQAEAYLDKTFNMY